VQRLIAAGEVPAKLLVAADHEADALEHPYIGVEHLELARLRLAGRLAERDALRATLPVGITGSTRWWRPRGPRSARRRPGILAAERARRAAQQAERDDSQ
jgi:hypothetical protein